MKRMQTISILLTILLAGLPAAAQMEKQDSPPAVEIGSGVAGNGVDGSGERGFGSRSLCGSDDRLPAYTFSIGRVRGGNWGSPAGTAYIICNGALLTAGHVPTGGPYGGKVDFNVPLSESNGDPNFPAEQYVFEIDQGSVVSVNDGDPAVGQDWKVFSCQPNGSTGALVGSFGFVRLLLPGDIPSGLVAINGYGEDDGVFNMTEQDDEGLYLGEHIEGADDIWLEYIVDTMFGNSGSPILLPGTMVSIGIHTDAGCDPPLEGNKGTSFTNTALRDAITDYFDGPVVYVDADHPAPLEDGTIFRPYDTLEEAVAAAPADAVINIVEGLYGDTPSITTPMTLTAPVGHVYLGYQGKRGER